ncbi:MAG: cation transporter [Acidimicrobiia bacterium]|nr:cation transporter [Acidimicrobiia bacterium]
MRAGVVVELSVRAVFHAVLVGSIYLLFAGHNQPGGGFVGGLLAGAAVALRYVAGGIEEVRGLSRLKPWTILGGGLLLAGATAAAPLLAGRPVLESGYLSADLPLFGDVKATAALPFDTGVYLVVVGLVLMIFEAFGDEPDDVVVDLTEDRRRGLWGGRGNRSQEAP